MTDTEPAEHALTSPCGNVTVRLAEGRPPKVELAKAATALFPRDLAELIAETARDAADAARAQAPEPETPSLDDALKTLTEFRDGLRDNGYAATIAEQRAQFEPPPVLAEGERPPKGPKLALPPMAFDALDTAIGLWQRYQAEPPGTGKGPEHELPTGRGKSEGKLATVEAAFAYPIADVTLSRHACELGAGALESQLNEAAAAAKTDLDRQQGAYMTTLGVPIDPDEASTMTDQSEQLGASGLEVVETARHHHERITRAFTEGGHFA